MMTRFIGLKKTGFATSSILSLAFMVSISLVNSAFGAEVKTVWNASADKHPLKSWTLAEIQKLKSFSHHEKDPVTGQSGSWKGPEMSTLVDKTIESLPAEQRAQVDLIILKDSAGKEIRIPRSLLVRFPVILSPQGETAKLVLPLSSKPKIWEEGLPLGLYQLHGVSEIEFANSHNLYGLFYLKSRKDPLAVRGEKIFVQNCLSCHAGNPQGEPMGFEKSARKLASASHPDVKNAPQLKSREMKALISYLDAFRLENPSTSGGNLTGK
jgi:mono/diheme cytochrome c family protein